MASRQLDEVLEQVERLAPLIRERAGASERAGNVDPEVVAAFRDAGLFGIMAPAELGGLGMTLPDFIRVSERMAELDASTSWTFTILASGPLFARNLPPDVFAKLCGPPPSLLVGSLNPIATRAERTNEGYTYTGTASYLSGSAHADWIMAGAIVTEGGEPVITEAGIEIRLGLIPIDQARSLDTWHVTGMRATGSTDYSFENVAVAPDWTFEPFRVVPTGDDVLSAIPIWAQLGGTLAACAVGAARNMIDRFVELAEGKVPAGTFTALAERPSAQMALGEAEGLARAARATLHDCVDRVWALGAARDPFANETLAGNRAALVTAVRLAAQSIDLLHDAAGMNAIKQDSVLDRCWRDVHTMTQHVLLSPARFEIAGRVLMGLDPGAPVI